MIIKVWNSKNYCIYTNPKSVGFQVCFLQPHSLELQQIMTLYLITTKPTDYHSDNTCSHYHNTQIERHGQLLYSETQHSDQLGTRTCITKKTIKIPHNQLRKFDKEYLTPLNKPHQNTTCCKNLMLPRSSQKPMCSLSF